MLLTVAGCGSSSRADEIEAIQQEIEELEAQLETAETPDERYTPGEAPANTPSGSDNDYDIGEYENDNREFDTSTQTESHSSSALSHLTVVSFPPDRDIICETCAGEGLVPCISCGGDGIQTEATHRRNSW